MSILHSENTGIVSKGLTHDFLQKLEKFSSQSDFRQRSLKIMFDDHPRRKQAFSYTIQISILHSGHGHIEIFSKGLTRDFGRRLEISYLLVLGQK